MKKDVKKLTELLSEADAALRRFIISIVLSYRILLLSRISKHFPEEEEEDSDATVDLELDDVIFINNTR